METDTQHPSNEAILNIWKHSDNITRTKETIENKFSTLSLEVNTVTLNTKIRRLNDKVKHLSKNKRDKELEAFLYQDFQFPKYSAPATEPLQNNLQETENRTLKRHLENLETSNEDLNLQINNYEQRISVLMGLLDVTNTKFNNAMKSNHTAKKLEKEINEWEDKYSKLADQLDKTIEDLEEKKKKQCTRNLNKKIKRRDETIQVKESVILEKESEVNSLKDVCKEKDDEVKELKREKKGLLVKVCRLRSSKERSNSNCILDKNLEIIDSLKSEIRLKEKKIIELEQINAIFQDPTIDCFHDGKYSNEIRSTIMALITECGVSQTKVNNVMQTVLQNLTGKTLCRLPSTGVKCRLMLEARRVAQRQVADAMLQTWSEPSEGNTLHQDGTSKFHRHFQSFQITTADGSTLSAGLSEVSRGNTNTILQEFKNVVSELAASISPSTSKEHIQNVARLIVSIIATMSDQGSVNPVFNDKLQSIREDLLPVVFGHWDTMSADIKAELGKLLSFFCKMHIFVNMANETDNCLAQFEKHIIAEGRNPYAFHLSESGSSRLVRTLSKAFTSHGCEKSGVAGHFATYLRQVSIDNKLISFRGHRFNHLFYAAGATYYHISHIKDFLQKWSDPNELLKSIHFDIDETVYISGVRALGIIDKVVTGPFWRLIEAAPNVLALNRHLYQLKSKLENWAQDATSVLTGESLFNEDEVSITKDIVYECLFSQSDNPILDTYTQMALELCFGGMLLVLERQAKDQLPGGKYWDVNQNTLKKASSVPTTNTVSERDFAQLDMLMRAKPSASTTSFESIIMWSNNKTSAWLSTLSDEQYNTILDDARRNAPHIAIQMKLKQQALYTGKLEHLKEKQEKKKKQEEKTHATKVTLTHKITEAGGLWTTHAQLNEYKTSHSESLYKEALISQIYFRKSVLGSSGPKELFQQQHKGHVFSLTQLEDNLQQILLINEDNEGTEVATPKLTYKCNEEASHVVSDLKTKLKARVEEGRKKIIISQQKNKLPHFIENPSLLEGTQVKHKCRDPDTKEVEWYRGIVKKISSPHLNPMKTQYAIKYEEDTDEWNFPLLRDFANGDLIIIE